MCFSKDTHKWKYKPQTGQCFTKCLSKKGFKIHKEFLQLTNNSNYFFNGQKMWIVSLQKINVDGKYSHEKMPNMINH